MYHNQFYSCNVCRTSANSISTVDRRWIGFNVKLERDVKSERNHVIDTAKETRAILL